MPSVLNLGYVDCEKARRIWVRSGDAEWVHDSEGKTECHDPMDRVGWPYRISAFVSESDGRQWFLFAVGDCHFPLHDLVRGDSFESAYEAYLDWAAEHRHIAITEDELPDYMDGDNFTGSYTSDGKPVDTDNVQGHEVTLLRIDF
jgi:hypothetical protein